MLEFDYSGLVRKITAQNAGRVYYTLIGGGGGGGGNDSAAGTRGTKGGVVGGYIDVSQNDVLYVAVGGGGAAGGSYRGNIRGGVGGASLIGYSGGEGGNSGAWGSSGGGGGGGGATVLYKKSGSSNVIIAVAHGGGGGGGGGNRVPGTFVSDNYYGSSTSTLPDSYPNVYNDAWSSIGRSYGVWPNYTQRNTFIRMSWAFNAPSSGTYYVRFSVDNYGEFLVNGSVVAQCPYWGSETSTNYASYVEKSIYLYQGGNVFTTAAANLSGPAMVAAAVYDSNWNLVWHTRNNINKNLLSGMGASGQQNRYDGGGGGGGGGGYTGGAGGRVAGDVSYRHSWYGGPVEGADWGGQSGSPGVSSILLGSSNSNGAGGTTMTYNYGSYGAAESSGSSGFAAFSSKETKLYALSGSNWKSVGGVYVRKKGLLFNYWKEPEQVYVRKNNAWVSLYGDNVPSYQNDYNENFKYGTWGETTYTQYTAPYSGDYG